MTLATDYPEINPALLAGALRREHNRANRAQLDWMEEVIGLPFAGIPSAKNLCLLLAAARGDRLEAMIDIAFEGVSAAHNIWMEAAAMADAYQGADRSNAAAPTLNREVA